MKTEKNEGKSRKNHKPRGGVKVRSVLGHVKMHSFHDYLLYDSRDCRGGGYDYKFNHIVVLVLSSHQPSSVQSTPFAIPVLRTTGEFLGSWPTTEISCTRTCGRPLSSSIL